MKRPTFRMEQYGYGRPFGLNLPVPAARVVFAVMLPLLPIIAATHAVLTALVFEPDWLEEIGILARAVVGRWVADDDDHWGTWEEINEWKRKNRIPGRLIHTGKSSVSRDGTIRLQWRVQQ